MSKTLEVFEQRWGGACRVLFGAEACSFTECEDWLKEFVEPLSYKKSSISGKEVISAPTDYCNKAKWLSFNEVDFSKKFTPLSINEVKDIDSILNAISERMYYSGNVVFGNSSNIEKSSNVNDSHYMYRVGRHGNSKYIAHSAIGRLNEDCFGCNGNGESAFCVRCFNSFRNKRCFEAWVCQTCSDCYYSSGLTGCSECLFCFNLRSKRHCIGNLPLEVSKYKKIKEKLVAEMREILSKEKKLPSLVELVSKSPVKKPIISGKEKLTDEEFDKEKIENAFLDTTRVIFGKPLEGGIDSYSKWLTRHTKVTVSAHSAATGKELFMPNTVNYSKLPRDRLLNENEARELGEKVKMLDKEVNELSMQNVHEKITMIAFFNVDLFGGNNHNNMECSLCFDSVNNYRSSLLFYGKNSGYCFWPRNSDHVFGCDSSFSSEFSVNCYSCTNQTRCFEIDCSGYCSDSYFLHNCEGMRNSMFCFNVKNRSNCIGNSEFSIIEYGKIKKAIMEQIYGELSTKKDLKYDIYNVGCKS
ncbi:MAG: hypothetical protein Q7S22_06160 [Candidatus Micrarchaeota archaeon]|nr:hypothetical protein [Candidatus Micrarchaeota archaeon]